MILRNALSFTVVFFMSDSTDATGRTAKTGLTPTVQVSKNGGAFATVTPGTPSEIANGWYKIDLSTTETNTNGPLIVRATGTGADEWRDVYQVSSGIVANVMQWNASSVTSPNTAGTPVVDVTRWNGTAVPTPDTAGYPKVTIKDGTGTGEIDLDTGGVLLSATALAGISSRIITDAFDKGDGLFDPATDSPQAIRDRGDAAWTSTTAIHSGTAQAGTTTTITLQTTASTTANYYNGANIIITGGTGVGQPDRIITAYTTGRVATLDAAWATAPDSTTTYEIGPGRAQAAGGSIASVSGAVGSVTGSVASVTGNVAGNVVGSVGSVATGGITTGSFASGAINAAALATDAITAAKIAADAIGASELAADAVTEIVTGVLTTAMTESYNADGSTATLAQALYLIMQMLTEASTSSTTLTVKKLDGSTNAATFTLNSATAPTSITRST